MPPIKATPRSVSDATRFTPTTPHASSKAAEPRFTIPASSRVSPLAAVGGSSLPRTGGSSSGGGIPPTFHETPEQKVARLRAAHLRAKAAQVSKFDKVIDGGRRFFDTAHKVTVMGLIGFTILAGFVTVYTAVDMITYNSKRKAEFVEAQKKLEADSLEAARLAYMSGKATEEQTALVEEAMERDNYAPGGSGIFTKMPNVLSKPNSSGFESAVATQHQEWPKDNSSATTTRETAKSGVAAAEEKAEAAGKGLWGWMTASLKKEEEGEDVGSTQRRLGWESLSEEDDGAGVRDSDLVRAVEGYGAEKKQSLATKAHAAFEKEKENQRKGGPLDHVGLKKEEGGDENAEKTKKKGGWLW
ncbi:cytochrome oxidase c assembly-domain-containing protein [Rhypophila decipiens]|uniref:Cytochrome oxidase c assembly-domain-containing protein n=1 Tax=Rhypophila decipiens TaxID=261697 RepID=A0AAN6Y581_9PEZI|nr:cytochrome oxidase c assembly-domain-containing protein [Rhypophila decipiens]